MPPQLLSQQILTFAELSKLVQKIKKCSGVKVFLSENIEELNSSKIQVP